MKASINNRYSRGFGLGEILSYLLMLAMILLMGVAGLALFKGGITANANKAARAERDAMIAPLKADYAAGACAACHGVDGRGMPGNLAPTFHGSELVNGDVDKLVVILTKGILPSGQYNGAMAPVGMTWEDQKIANILSYIRIQFNESEPVTVEEVAAAREKHKALPPMPSREVIDAL